LSKKENKKDGSKVFQIEEINLKTKLLSLETQNGEILVDVQALLKAPVGSEEAYFRGTGIAQAYKKDIRDFLRLDGTIEYIDILKEEVNSGVIPQLKRGYDFFYTKRGRYNSGTWLHNELFLEFASWVDVRFRRDMHKVIKKLIIYSDQLKIDRLDTKFLYKELGETVKEIYLEKQSENGKRFAYQNLANLINLKVLGYTAKQYRELHNVDPNIAIRDTLPDEVLEEIIEVEKDMNGYIKYGEIYDYDTLKKKILSK
jgi:hypothetical protein